MRSGDVASLVDLDGSGTVDMEELPIALGLMGVQLSADELAELVHRADEDGSGSLDLEESKALVLEAKDELKSAWRRCCCCRGR